MRSYFTIARVSRDIFRQSSVGALYTDWECPTTGEFNRVGGVDTHLKFNPNWTLDGQAVASSSNLNLNCEANLYPFSSGNRGNGNYYAGPAEKLELQRDGLHFAYDGTYNDITPGFVIDSGIHQSRGHSRNQRRRSTTAFVRRKAGLWVGGRR